MEHAAPSEENQRLRVACIYALQIYYKFYRIGIFYISEYAIREEIEKIDIPEENEIKKLLEEGAKSTDENIKYWAELALEPI